MRIRLERFASATLDTTLIYLTPMINKENIILDNCVIVDRNKAFIIYYSILLRILPKMFDQYSSIIESLIGNGYAFWANLYRNPLMILLYLINRLIIHWQRWICQ